MLTILSPWKLHCDIIVPFTESVTICDVIQGLFYKQPLQEQTASCFQNSSVQPLFLTSFGIPITFQYSLFEEWALAKHWHSMFTSLLDNSKFTFFVTTRSDCIISNSLFNLQEQPPGVLCKKGFFRNFAKFTGKHLCQSLIFIKVAGLRRFPVNHAKFLRKTFLQNTSRRLLLNLRISNNSALSAGI